MSLVVLGYTVTLRLSCCALPPPFTPPPPPLTPPLPPPPLMTPAPPPSLGTHAPTTALVPYPSGTAPPPVTAPISDESQYIGNFFLTTINEILDHIQTHLVNSVFWVWLEPPSQLIVAADVSLSANRTPCGGRP